MVKAVFFDVDGTLFSFATHKIPQSAIFALEQLRRKGIKLFISTGRYPADLRDLLKDMSHLFDGFITLSGQYCYDPQGCVLHDQSLDKRDLITLADYVKDRDIACGFMELDYYYYNRVNEAIHKMNQFLGDTVVMRPVDSTDRVRTHKTYQLNIFLPPEREDEILRLLPHCKSARWCPYFTDVMPIDGGKAAGIRHVLAHYGISPDECMSFGDGGNDAEMLRYTGIGVAMGNAGDEARQAADYITDDVDSDGILNALKHFGVL